MVDTTAAAAPALGKSIAAIGAGIAFLGGALATGYAQSNIGAAAMGLMAEKDGIEGKVLLFLALPETMVILGFVIAYLILSGA